jgi:D-alanyl-D-alanine carboxypeptidase
MALHFLLFAQAADFRRLASLSTRGTIVVNLKQPIQQPNSGSGLRFFIPALLAFFAGGILVWLVCRPPSAQASATKTPAAPAAEIAKPPPPPPVPVEPTMANFQLLPPVQSLSPSLSAATGIARTGILIDLTNRQILWEKKADEAVEIASMTKMMTAYLMMQAIHVDKTATLKDVVPVTRSAALIGGSQVWLDVNEKFTLEELSRAMMIKSANDAAYLIAEHLAGGSADVFVARMNEMARKLGMVTMHFYNPHGLPPDAAHQAPENTASARELAFLASRLLEYPDVIRWTSTDKDEFHHQTGKNPVTALVNHNSLVLEKYPGVNGMKTGYTRKSMYCTTVTCTRNGRTMIVVLSGCPIGTKGGNGSARDNLAKKLLDWAYSQPGGAVPAVPAVPAAVSIPLDKPALRR